MKKAANIKEKQFTKVLDKHCKIIESKGYLTKDEKEEALKAFSDIFGFKVTKEHLREVLKIMMTISFGKTKRSATGERSAT